MANIYNISSNYNFLESFLFWLTENFGAKIADLKILLPNRRAVREFQYLYEKKFTTNAKLPKIKAIADISIHDFFDSFPKDQIQDIVDEVSQIKVLSGFDYLFFLSQEIVKTKVFGENINFSQALNIAAQLKNLFDEIERQEIDIETLYNIDDSDLAAHRQFTLEFLQKFYLRIKNSILKNNVILPISYQNLIINNYARCIEKYGLKSHLIIAGSTGSVNFSKKLIKATSQDKNGKVVLYGLTKAMVALDDEKNPQFILNELLKFCKITKNDVAKIAYEKFKICGDERLDFLSFAMLPSQETYRWSNFEEKIDISEIKNSLEKNFSYIQAKNEVEEARIIAVACFKAINENKTAAIIANNHHFVGLVKSQLKNFNLDYNDARSLDLSASKLINFILLLLELFENNFDSQILLAIFKHPFCIADEENVKNFEINILRQQRYAKGLSAIKSMLQSQDENLQKFFSQFLQHIQSLANIGFETDIADCTTAIITTVENLSQKPITEILSCEEASEEILELFEKLKSQKGFFIKRQEMLKFFSDLFAQIRYFEKRDTTAPIQILSTLEARLLNFDVVIISSLNQGDFPQIEGENWLGRKLRSELGIDLSQKKYGQNAYDFCNYLSNKNVIMTRCKTKSGAIAIASPFILRLEILCKKSAINLKKGEEYFALLNDFQNKQTSPKPLNVKAKPPVAARPKKLAITDISQLLSDPYQIYAKRVLQLQKLNDIDYEPEYKEFGSFVHHALEEYVKNSQHENFTAKAKEIFTKYFKTEESLLVWWPKFENIFNNFVKENEALDIAKNYVEIPVKIFINDVLIRGKIDRVAILSNDEMAVFDYKTGQIPAIKDVKSGLQPQLTIYALMLALGMIEDKNLKNISVQKIKSLNYWKISATNESEIKSMFKSNDEIAIAIACAKAGLEKLIDYYNNYENGYEANLNGNYRHDYSHLARVF